MGFKDLEKGMTVPGDKLQQEVQLGRQQYALFALRAIAVLDHYVFLVGQGLQLTAGGPDALKHIHPARGINQDHLLANLHALTF
jgi:hypothetical protein